MSELKSITSISLIGKADVTGVTLQIGTKVNHLAGIKNKIETNEILTIPENYEYNIFKLDVDGVVNNNGEINFL